MGRGSDEGIDLLTRAFCTAGRDSVLVCPPTFGMYAVAARIQGAGVVSVPLKTTPDFALDVPAIIAALDNVKLVHLCTPNNPTGTRLDEAAKSAVERWRFVPARQGDAPVEAAVLVPLNFTLNH